MEPGFFTAQFMKMLLLGVFSFFGPHRPVACRGCSEGGRRAAPSQDRTRRGRRMSAQACRWPCGHHTHYRRFHRVDRLRTGS
jgi:hypothetical protein